jgi:hypothetical protein
MDLAAQHRDLMPQHEDLYLVARSPRSIRCKVQQPARDQMPERQDHDLGMTTKAATAPDKPHVRRRNRVFARYRLHQADGAGFLQACFSLTTMLLTFTIPR